MRTKEEIINECIPLADDDYIELPNGADLSFIKKEVLPKAMDEYAKEQAEMAFNYSRHTNEAGELLYPTFEDYKKAQTD
jgi:hypothetical protein